MKWRVVAWIGSAMLLGIGLGSRAAGVTAVPCPPTPNTLPSADVSRGSCLFKSSTAFGQDASGPYASCAHCHYGSDKSDHGVHLIQITNTSAQTIEVLRKTPN